MYPSLRELSDSTDTYFYCSRTLQVVEYCNCFIVVALAVLPDPYKNLSFLLLRIHVGVTVSLHIAQVLIVWQIFIGSLIQLLLNPTSVELRSRRALFPQFIKS